MPLFTNDDLKVKNLSECHDGEPTEAVFKMVSPTDLLRRKMGDLKPGVTTHFVSDGTWSLIDFVRYAAMQTGPASLVGFAWSFKGTASRQLAKMKSDGLLTDICFIIDSAMSRLSRDAIGEVRHLCREVRTTQIHANGFLIENDAWKVCCISSMNFSNNPRIEAGFITTEPDVYQFTRTWAMRALERGQVFEKFTPDDDSIRIPIAPQPGKEVFLVRGLPGSGKSTVAAMLATQVCEEDDFFLTGDRYKFDTNAKSMAEAYCRGQFKEALSDGIDRIAVANCFPTHASMDFYVAVAQANGYRVHVVVVEGGRAKNIHQVGDDRIRQCREAFEVTL